MPRRLADIAKESSLPIETVIEAARVLEMKRANDLQVANGDIFDEQIAGIGEVLQQIVAAINPGDE